MNISGALLKATKSSEFVIRRNAPTLLTVGGVVGFTATVVLAIQATTKAVDILPGITAEVGEVKVRHTHDDYTEKQKTEDLIRVYWKHSLKLARIYGPTIAVGSLSIVSVLGGHGIMLKRQAGLVAAYATLDASYKEYRRRIVDEVGEKREMELYRNPRTRIVEDDQGKPCEIIAQDETQPSPYARYFDETSQNWTKTPEYNLMFLRAQQNWANDRLKAHGYLFLNEVLEALGLQRSQSGQIVGWKLKGEGDGYVDFGIYDIFDDTSRAFVNGFERTVLLDFNVDGPIKI
jgi:hypothetical protein